MAAWAATTNRSSLTPPLTLASRHGMHARRQDSETYQEAGALQHWQCSASAGQRMAHMVAGASEVVDPQHRHHQHCPFPSLPSSPGHGA
eukprot:365625-Chlamydomonas_euryale.AAC.11